MHHHLKSTINLPIDSTARLADDQEECAMWAGSGWQDSTAMQDAVGGNRVSTCQLCVKKDEIKSGYGVIWVVMYASVTIGCFEFWQRGKNASWLLSVFSFATTENLEERERR